MRLSLSIIAFMLCAVFLSQIYEYTSFNNRRSQYVIDKGAQTTATFKNQINKIITTIESEADRLAKVLGDGDFTSQQIQDIIKDSALGVSTLQGVTACFEPHAFDKKRKLFCPYYSKGGKDVIFVEDSYDYTDKTSDATGWYVDVLDGVAKWSDPYFGQAAQQWFTSYSVPFIYTSGPHKGKIRGVITMDLELTDFKNIVHSLSVGKAGYGIMMSNAGVFLSHPISEYIGTKNIKNIRDELEEDDLRNAYNKLIDGQEGYLSYYDAAANDTSLFFYDKIPASGWGIGLSFYKEDLLGNAASPNRRYINMVMTVSLFFVVLLALYFGRDRLDRREIWELSIVSTLLLLANICFVGYLEHTTSRAHGVDESPPVIDLTSLGQFVGQQHARSDKLKIERATPIPTGIYLERMEFQDSYNLNIGGSIWQKYPLDIAQDVEIGFDLPQMSPFSEASYIEEIHREEVAAKEGQAGYLRVVWNIRATLLLNFDYKNYPLDKRHLNIEMVPLNSQDHLLFVPDLQGYSYTNPSQKSGLNEKIEISGNEIIESYFNFSTKSYNTDFGSGVFGLYEDVPVLHYNIFLRRILVNAFVISLIPIFVTLAMVYIMLSVCGKTDERQGIIESMAAFFFVLIFSHIDLRKDIVTADLIYMEYFYFITYIILILSTLNLMVYTKSTSPAFDYNENQIYKAVYFPLFLLMVLMITLLRFY